MRPVRNSEYVSVINFIGEVNYFSMSELVSVVQRQNAAGYDKFVLSINSVGGLVYSAMYAVEQLSAMRIEINTFAVGNVDSAAIYLYCLGEKRYAASQTSFLFHPVSGQIGANTRTQRAVEVSVDSMKAWSSAAYDDCFGGIPEDWEVDREDYRATAVEAREFGLVNATGSPYSGNGALGASTTVIGYAPTQGSR